MRYEIPRRPQQHRARTCYRHREGLQAHRRSTKICDFENRRAGRDHRPESFCNFRMISSSSAKRRLRARTFRSLPPTLSHEYAEQICVHVESFFFVSLAANTILNTPIGRSAPCQTCVCAYRMRVCATRTHKLASVVHRLRWCHSHVAVCAFVRIKQEARSKGLRVG